MSRKQRYPRIKLRVVVRDRNEEEVLTYTFWLDDAKARQAFAARCPDAWTAGQSVTTYEDEG